MRILVACEFSGIVREAFAERGHDAWSCDLLPSERAGNHIQDDVLRHLDDGWDMMIAHPPCTYLSHAGARHLYPKGTLNQSRYQLGLEAKAFFLRLLDSDIRRICVENPMPSPIYELPAPSQIIQPYYFGHPFSKKTYLWLKNLNALSPTSLDWRAQSTKVAGNWFNAGGGERQKNRAKTFEGIANAMAAQWG